MSDTDGHSCAPLAYMNPEFLESRDGRAMRIMSEFLFPLSQFRKEKVYDTIVFFGSARIQEDGPLGEYYNAARELAKIFSEWSDGLDESLGRRFAVCTGGGPGIMEAANRGAYDAGSRNLGLNIGLPFEQHGNPYITPELCMEFRYFFMRKFWFAYPAKAMVVFPGGFGTLDEFFELLTLVQTQKLAKEMVIVLYGSSFWKEVVNFDALVKFGTISPEDVNLFQYADDPETALTILKDGLTKHYLGVEGAPGGNGEETPSIAKSRI
jgi:uncharacterized protein (TIGR00730 family)